VPWIKNVGQRGYQESDLPSPELKRALYERGKEMLADLGYYEIGMDHFALDSDSLYISMKAATLHRNFMGYTTNQTKLIIGLGMSSIGDSWYGYAQNLKSVESYTQTVNKGELPVFRGHSLNKEDLIIRRHILNIMCQFTTSWKKESDRFEEMGEVLDRLKEMISDDWVVIGEDQLMVPEKYRPFVRNVCLAFDLHLHRAKPTTRVFSMTI
jgi:oxygen-independent coproporphyrinogen-3 oxidase